MIIYWYSNNWIHCPLYEIRIVYKYRADNLVNKFNITLLLHIIYGHENLYKRGDFTLKNYGFEEALFSS